MRQTGDGWADGWRGAGGGGLENSKGARRADDAFSRHSDPRRARSGRADAVDEFVCFRIFRIFLTPGGTRVGARDLMGIPAFAPRSGPPHARAPRAQVIRMASDGRGPGRCQGSQDSGAGVARAIGHVLAWAARAWRGHGAGVARACLVTPGVYRGGGGLRSISDSG
eukprot:gene7599-biopygen12063